MRRLIQTPGGPASAEVFEAARTGRSRSARGVLVLGHGAGGGTDARDLQALAATLPRLGTAVVLVEQPWRLAGRKVAVRPAALDIAWRAVLEELAAAGLTSAGLVVGGRSAGARVACRTAAQVGAVAVLALAFPLHPPGRPERSRGAELAGAGVPTLVVQGTRDAFGAPEDFPAGVEVVGVPGADHGFKVGARAVPDQATVLADLVAAVAGWLPVHAP
ncbi:MAG: alpha/beta hydrolase family protein [Sporichthyaceae bacterium]